MNAIIIYSSKHLGNTKKIALEIASKIGIKALDFNSLPENFDISTYELVGIGSGIYARSFDHKLIKWLKTLKPTVDKQKCFLFSTSGAKHAAIFAQKKIDEILNIKNREIIGR
jgi:menaquinone-dependent protoporphyrinogen IX oxidase